MWPVSLESARARLRRALPAGAAADLVDEARRAIERGLLVERDLDLVGLVGVELDELGVGLAAVGR